MIHIRAQVHMIDPNLAGSLNPNIISGCQDFGNFEVANDHVIRIQDSETNTGESYLVK